MDESSSPSPLPSPVASKESTPPTPPDNEDITKNNNSSTTSTTSTTGTTTSTTTTSPTTTTTTTTSGSSVKKVKKIKPISRAPIATGISTNIPVTGEKPKPIQEGDASLEDNVLYSIFVILYEKDPQEEGMTVKQLCEMLETLHPELVNMSSKTSNLVSAKLNAYIKKLEKTDTTLKYAISREWADASPKRMVYKYRGLLAPGWEKVLDELKKSQQYELINNINTNNNESIKKVESSIKNLDLSDDDNNNNNNKTNTNVNSKDEIMDIDDNDNDLVNGGDLTTKNKTGTKQIDSQSAATSPKQQQQQKHKHKQSDHKLQLQHNQQQSQQQQQQQPSTKRRATMFDFGRRPSFLNLDEFPQPPPPYLVNKSKITSAIDDDEVFIDIEEEDEDGNNDNNNDNNEGEEEDQERHVIVKKRRTISSISKFNWGNLGATELDTAAITAMRRESVPSFLHSTPFTSFPCPLDTSLEDLEKLF